MRTENRKLPQPLDSVPPLQLHNMSCAQSFHKQSCAVEILYAVLCTRNRLGSRVFPSCPSGDLWAATPKAVSPPISAVPRHWPVSLCAHQKSLLRTSQSATHPPTICTLP
jgi:hypothetical protein